MADPAHVLTSHLINQIRASLSILEQLNVLPAGDADAIRTKLPPPNGPFPALSSKLDAAFSQMTIATAPPPVPQRSRESRGKALWDYTGNVGAAYSELMAGSGRSTVQSGG